MKSAIPQVFKLLPRCAVAVAALVLTLSLLAEAQETQFAFDARGNLVAQTVATSAPPQIVRQPQNQVVSPGDIASFSVLVADTRALSYQWYFNGNPIIGATFETLLRRDFTASDEGQYAVLLTNPSGSVTSAPALLMMDADADGLADSWEQAHFGSLTQYSGTDYDGDGVSNLNEFLDGTDPTDGSSVLFRLTVMSDGGQVEVSPSRFQFTNGEMVTLTATAFAPHAFHGWGGDIESTNNPITLTITNNTTVFTYLSSYDLTWISSLNGDWYGRSNWNPRVVPLSNDNVFLTQESVSTTLNGSAICRSLTLGSSSANPTLTGTGELTILADSSWIRGTMSGSGRMIVSPNSSFEIGSGSTHFLSGGRTLENGGTIVWSGGGLTMGGITITNHPGALFEIQTAGTLSVGGANQFNNAGTFRKSVNPGTASWTVTFNNSGLVDIQTGRFALTASGTHSGRFEMAAGASLSFSAGGGTHVADAASVITGAGDLIVGGNTIVTLAGLVNPGGVHTFSGGTLNLNGNYICTNNPVTISGATVNFNGASTVAAVNLSNGTLGGTAVLSVMNTMNWSGGTMSGSGRTVIPPSASLNINNGNIVALNTRTLENGGTAIWSGGAGMNVNSAVITNRAGALFELRNNATFVFQAGSFSRFDNAGTLRKAVAAGTSTFGSGVVLNNYATTEVQAGTFLFSASCTNTGAFALSPGTTVRFAGGGSSIGSLMAPATALVEWTANAFALNPGAQLNGAGLYKINGAAATLTCNANAALENLDLLGILNGSGVITISNVMNWTSGSMGGSGRTRIAPGATLNLNNPAAMMLQRTLENGGTTLWTGANVTMDSSVITNRPGALFHAQNAATLMQRSGFNRFDNAGVFRKSGNTGTTTLTTLVNLNNYNTVDIRSGILAANGGYTSITNALLNCAIAGTTAGSGFGQLQVGGTVNLNGSLGVDFVNGFIPATNDSFTVVTAGVRNGSFADFSYPSSEVTMQLSNTPTSVIIRVTGVTPHIPILLTPELSGADIRLIWTSISNRIYRLEFKPELNVSNWTVLPGDVTSLSNSASKLDTLTPTNRFYRVRVVPVTSLLR